MQIGSHSAPLIHLQAPGFSDHRHEIAQPTQRASHHLSSGTNISELGSFFSLKRTFENHAPAASVPNALCGAPRNAANWAGARFAGTTAIDSDPPDQLDCMDADDVETEDGVGPSGYSPGPSGVAEASNNAHLRVPQSGFPYKRRHISTTRSGLTLTRCYTNRTPSPLAPGGADTTPQIQTSLQTLELGSRSYEVSAYVASPDNSCKGVITGALPIPTEDALMNDTVTYAQGINIIQARAFGTNGAYAYTPSRAGVFPDTFTFKVWNFDADLSDQSPKCATAASEPATDTTSAHIRRNDEHHDGCVPRCLTCGSDEHATIDLGCPARQRRPGPRTLRDGRQLPEKPNTPPLRKNTEELPPHNQPRGSSQNADSQGPTRTARSKRPKIPNQGQQTSQPIQPQAPPPIQTPAHPSRNHPTPSSQCGAKSNATWPALPQRQSTHAPGLAARAAAPSASGSATGGHLNQVSQSQLQRRQDPLADSGKSPVEQASQMSSQSTPPHSPALVQQTCAQYFQTPEFTQGLTQLVLKFVSDSLEAVKTQLSREQEQALQRMETTFSHRMEKIDPRSRRTAHIREFRLPQRLNMANSSNRQNSGRAGRNLLRTLRLEPSGTMRNEEAWSPIPIKVAAHMQLKPLPRNMNRQRHPGRRKARADYYIRWYRNRDDVLYVDAAVGPLEGTATAAAAMTEDGRINTSASIKTARPDVAEGVALALAVAHAVADSTITEICADSQSAYRYFRQGIAPNTVSRILRNIPSLPHPVTITWVPGHECIPGNERVNAHVRGLSIRTLEDHSPKPVTKPEEGICTYHQITSYYRNGRRDLPAPHYSLTPNQSSRGSTEKKDTTSVVTRTDAYQISRDVPCIMRL
ncbi:hypothetical protein HPB52_000256 [Rhipicephalus sanguineus]|uniref:RNase H type-1 domain-containing protein n=1 Tax=Rhipicephalus sanguineus TaxID=34632 RepID=A0A9D4PL91_RHISA|nr:hypothetical protein HPB52_000256 [Rhipicephalus sanguineus]